MSVTLTTVAATLGGIAACVVAVEQIMKSCNGIYDQVNIAIQNLNDMSSGRFTENLVDIHQNKLKPAYKDLMNGMEKMVESVRAIHDENEQADQNAASSLKGANSKY